MAEGEPPPAEENSRDEILRGETSKFIGEKK